MKLVVSLVVLSCALFEAKAYPYAYAYYPSYGNVDSLSYGDGSRGGMALSRYYNPYYDQRGGGGSMAAFMFRQPETQATPQQSGQYYLPDRRRQTQQEVNYIPPQQPQQNEVYYPQQPENPAFVPTEATELAEPSEKAEAVPTTEKAAAIPELVEPEAEDVPQEEPVQKTKKAVNKKKQVKRPIDDDDEDEYVPKMPAAAFFPMLFGYGGGSRGAGGPGGPTAIANAYSTGKGGVATSHATAYGSPRIEERV